jgi:multiple sugar transport system substrate-binding protein
MRRASVLLSVLFTMGVLCLQGGLAQSAASDKVELRFTVWTGNAAHLEMLNGIAAKYTAIHPKITVKFDTIPYDDYPQKLAIELAGSNPPDAGWITERDAPVFIAANALLDISGAAAKYDYADFAKSATALWEKSGKVFGIPFSNSPVIVFYNQTLFEKAGIPTPTELAAKGAWTWEAFAAAAKKIKEKTGSYGYQTMDGVGYTDNVWETIVPMIRAYGSDIWNANGKVTIDSAEAVKAMSLLHAMIYDDKSIVPPGEEADFFAGAAGMTLSQISRVSKLQSASFKWGIAVLPKGPAGEAQVIGQAAVVAFKSGKHAADAMDFVSFMTNKENVATMMKYFPPARVSVLDSEAFSRGNPLVAPEMMKSVVGYALKTGKILPSNSNFPKIDLVARSGFDQLWQANADVKSVLSGISSSISPLIK